jgi:hypothetical protein
MTIATCLGVRQKSLNSKTSFFVSPQNPKDTVFKYNVNLNYLSLFFNKEGFGQFVDSKSIYRRRVISPPFFIALFALMFVSEIKSIFFIVYCIHFLNPIL